MLTVPNGAQIFSADGESWIDLARGLVKYGIFVNSANPDVAANFRTPLFPVFLAGTLLAAGDRFSEITVLLQIVLLFATGLVAYRITEDWLPRYGPAALAVTVFNPNSFGSAHIIQSETLYAMGIALFGWAVLAYCKRPSVTAAGLAGGVLGISALIRPDIQFLIPIMPIGLILLAQMRGPKIKFRRQLIAAAACLSVCMIVISPWLIRNSNVGVGPRLTSAAAAQYYLWDSAGQIEMNASGVSQREAGRRMRTRISDFIRSQGSGWLSLSKRQRNERLAVEAARTILRSDPAAIAETVVLATLQFFVGGGAGDLYNLLGFAPHNSYEVMGRREHVGYLAAWLDALDDSPWPAVLITILAVGFVAVLRILGLAGLVAMVRRREYRLLTVVVLAISYFALVIPFYGQSRFRIPIEFLFVLLALYGFDGFRRLRRTAMAGLSGVALPPK